MLTNDDNKSSKRFQKVPNYFYVNYETIIHNDQVNKINICQTININDDT